MPELATQGALVEATPPAIAGPEAAALLLMLFGENEAAEVLRRLEPDQVHSLGEAMFAIANVSETDVNGAFDQFVTLAGTRAPVAARVGEQVGDMMRRALGPERASRMLHRIAPEKAEPRLAQLKWMTPDDVFAAVGEEHRQLVAVVLSHMDADGAAAVLRKFDTAAQDDIVFRIATIGDVAEDAYADIETLLDSAQAHAHEPVGSNAGLSEAAALVNRLDRTAMRRIITSVRKQDKALATRIEDLMLVFEDLAALDDKALGTLLRSVANDDLVLAIKGADEAFARRMLGSMSSRAAQTLEDEIAELGPVPRDDVVAAQRAVVAAAKALAEDGTLVLSGGGDDYV